MCNFFEHFTIACFNSQPPEGGWADLIWFALKATYVSTHSRPKAAGDVLEKELPPGVVSTHSRPKAAGHKQRMIELRHRVSTHSRPKAAGDWCVNQYRHLVRFNSQPPEGGWTIKRVSIRPNIMFQLTAARRRLVGSIPFNLFISAFQLTAARRRLAVQSVPSRLHPNVSTHSRPKAAGHSKGWFFCV